MQFLNLKISSPYADELKIQFGSGLNILSIQDKDLFSFFTQLPFLGMYGKTDYEGPRELKNVSCIITTTSASPGREICYMNSGGDFSIKETYVPGELLLNDEDEKPEPGRNREICTLEDFLTSSFFYHDLIQKSTEPVFEKEKIRTLLINNEIYRLNFSYFQNRDVLLYEKEKELTDFSREKQLLELKKMKKEKLLKEIFISERSVNRLEKKRDSILKYKTSLNEIIAKTENRNKLSSKINNLKKDLIELREIKEKVNDIEKTLRDKFSHFSEKGNDQIPDLEQIQNTFNSFRDVNEQLGKFFLNKKYNKGKALRIIASMIIFSLVAFLFRMFTNSASFILEITAGLAAGTAGLLSLVFYFKISRQHPAELFEQKKKLEENLIDILKKNNVSVDDCKTGELYEILFQYFEDFINYRDTSYELMELKKKISHSSNLIEKEKKLSHFTGEIEEIDALINEAIKNLDQSIHPRPELNDIMKTLHEMDELLEENGVEINEKKSLIVKFHEEIEEYDKIENSSLSAELKLDEIMKQIDQCREKIEHIKFLNTVFEKSSEKWSEHKLEELSRITLEKFSALTDNSFIKEDIADTLDNIILNSGRIKSEHRGLKKYISLSIKSALSGLLFAENIPPVFIIDPFDPENEFADNMKKLLPEMFPNRQVVVIVPGDDPGIKGNLITL